MTQTALLQQLRHSEDPDEAREIALELLSSSRKREMVDAALRTLEQSDLDDTARSVLRQSAHYYFDNDSKDNGALIREKLIRLLADLDHPDDCDLFLRGLNTYEVEPFMGEVTQNLRAVSLASLAAHQPELAHIYATKLLSEIDSTSQFSGEPAVTAINLLVQHEKTLPIYQFLLLGGLDALEAGQNEVVGKALESLGAKFPAALYRDLCTLFVKRDRAVVSMGLLTHIIENQVSDLYDVVDDILTSTRHDELHHYGVLLLAASRSDALVQRLFALAKLSPERHVPNFIEALELVPGPAKDDLLESLRRGSEIELCLCRGHACITPTPHAILILTC